MAAGSSYKMFDTAAIAAANSPETVFSKLNIPFVRKGHKLLSNCPSCGKSNKFDYNTTKDVYFCFAGGCEFGRDRKGVIDFVMDVLDRGFVDACKYLGGANELTPSEQRAAEEKRKEHAKRAKQELAKARRRTKKQMQDILAQCVPGEGTLAQTYLETRGHAAGIKALGWPKDILFHPGLEAFVGDASDKQPAGTFPAMISKGRDRNGKLVLLHRTYLEATQDGGARKASPKLPEDLSKLWNAKQMVGVLSFADLGVYLGATDGATHDPTVPVIVAEGIESALAMATAGAQGVIYAALSLNRVIGSVSADAKTMKGWRPPSKERPVIIACDNDLSPTPPRFECGIERAQDCFARAANRLSDFGYEVGTIFPPAGCDPEDWLFHTPETDTESEAA